MCSLYSKFMCVAGAFTNPSIKEHCVKWLPQAQSGWGWQGPGAWWAVCCGAGVGWLVARGTASTESVGRIAVVGEDAPSDQAGRCTAEQTVAEALESQYLLQTQNI